MFGFVLLMLTDFAAPGEPGGRPAVVAPLPAPIVLDCDDAGTAQLPVAGIDATAHGLTFAGVSPRGEGPSSGYAITVDGARWYGRKVFVHVSTDTPPWVEIRLDPADTARLYWTGEPGWVYDDDAERHMAAGATRRVLMPNCGRDTAGFFGGVLAPGPTCAHLIVTPAPDPTGPTGPGPPATSSSEGEVVTIPVPVAGGRC